MSENFNAWLQSVQSAIEKSLSDLLPSEKQFPEPLHQAMRYAVLDGGKRIRPLLVFGNGSFIRSTRCRYDSNRIRC